MARVQSRPGTGFSRALSATSRGVSPARKHAGPPRAQAADLRAGAGAGRRFRPTARRVDLGATPVPRGPGRRRHHIVVPQAATALRRLLADSRLRLPVVDTAPLGTRGCEPRATTVAPGHAARALADVERRQRASGDEREDAPERRLLVRADRGHRPKRRAAERALFRSLRKPQDGWTSRHLNRYISLSISRWLVKTPLRPNQSRWQF